MLDQCRSAAPRQHEFNLDSQEDYEDPIMRISSKQIIEKIHKASFFAERNICLSVGKRTDPNFERKDDFN